MSLGADGLCALRAALTAALTHEQADPDVADEVSLVSRLLARADSAPWPVLELPQHPAVAHLTPAIAATAAQFPELASALHPIAAALPWRYGYAPRLDLPDLSLRMAYAEIVGPAAPFRSDDVCLGLTFLTAQTLYPAHRHPAVELYRIVAGRPIWTVEDDTSELAPPAIVLHRSGAVHAMASGPEALLAIYSWTGDLFSPSVWVD
jgi:mannose-6-phosphate isomerase-like protein (cupin superfamily)